MAWKADGVQLNAVASGAKGRYGIKSCMRIVNLFASRSVVGSRCQKPFAKRIYMFQIALPSCVAAIPSTTRQHQHVYLPFDA